MPVDGIIRADGRRLTIYGLMLPARAKACRRKDGERWACGLRALVALHNLVTHSSMICGVQDGAAPTPARCKIGPIDVAATMLRGGWGVLAPGTTDQVLVEAQAAAQAAQVGIWSDTASAAGDELRQ